MCANLVSLSSFAAVRLGPKRQHRIRDRLQPQPTQTTGAASSYSSSINYNSDAQKASTIPGIDQPTHLVSLHVHNDVLLDLCGYQYLVNEHGNLYVKSLDQKVVLVIFSGVFNHSVEVLLA